MKSMNKFIDAFENALLQIDRVRASDIFDKNYSESGSFEELEQLVTETLERIGTGWEEGNISLSQVYMSGIICEELIENYLPRFRLAYKQEPKIAIAVLQDHHALGKRIVYSVMRAGGYDLLDFGHGISVDELVQKTIQNEVEILLISTLMLPSALKVATVINMLREQGSNAKVIVGGAPFRLDTNLWKKVNADFDGKNATEIISIIESILQGGN